MQINWRDMSCEQPPVKQVFYVRWRSRIRCWVTKYWHVTFNGCTYSALLIIERCVHIAIYFMYFICFNMCTVSLYTVLIVYLVAVNSQYYVTVGPEHNMPCHYTCDAHSYCMRLIFCFYKEGWLNWFRWIKKSKVPRPLNKSAMRALFAFSPWETKKLCQHHNHWHNIMYSTRNTEHFSTHIFFKNILIRLIWLVHSVQWLLHTARPDNLWLVLRVNYAFSNSGIGRMPKIFICWRSLHNKSNLLAFNWFWRGSTVVFLSPESSDMPVL